MAIQAMALGVNNPEINALSSLAAGQQARQSFDANNIAIAQKGLETIGSIALGAMGGDINGKPDPALFNQGLDYLAQQGIDVEQFRDRADLAPIIARSSMTALQQMQMAQDERAYQLALDKFEFDVMQAARAAAPTPGPTPLTDPAERARWGIPESDTRPYVIEPGKPPAVIDGAPATLEAPKREIRQGPDGIDRYVDTGEPVFPGIAPAPTIPDFDDTSGLRKEIQQLPSYKNIAQATPIYQAMVETAGRDTRASDLNLVYGLGKIMDPTSVVREGEMFMVQGINTLPDKLIEGVNSLLTGSSTLSPETREAILTEAYGRMKGYSDQFNADVAQYEGIVQRNNLNSADVIPAFDPVEPWQPPGAPPVVTEQEYQSLPSGSPFIAKDDPSQTIRIKP